MRLASLAGMFALACVGTPSVIAAEAEPFVPPATPLVACDPYFSVWSTGRTLTDADTTHWTGKPHRLTGLVRIDGVAHRFLGATPASAPALKATGQKITPTRSVYEFEGPGVALMVTFLTPALPEDIDLLSRPITYLNVNLRSTDGRTHSAELFVSASGELAVDRPGQPVAAQPEDLDGVTALRLGSTEQNVLGRNGDDLRIDWGYFYLAAPATAHAARFIGPRDALADAFVEGKTSGATPQAIASAPGGRVAAALVLAAPGIGAEPVERTVVLAYDDLYSIEYMESDLRPFWRRDGLDAAGLLADAVRDFHKLRDRCEAFDAELVADLRAAGGDRYAEIATLAYRQCFAAGKFVADSSGQPMQFSKENHSNGCIATSDVFYPMAPQFLLFGPTLAKSFLVPFMNYAESDRWKFPFAPHDLGRYPKANGQVYGGGETSEVNQMPVEECGNLLLLMGAVAKMEGHADFASRYWPQLTQWAQYLKAEGFDPDNQLCTDDFAGHLAHNVNLSAKAICALGAYGQLCKLRGDSAAAAEYDALARRSAAKWVEAADDGDHFRLAFDQPGTWSQKYNLVWDRLLGLGLFPAEVLAKEMAYYRKSQGPYGLPLDNRQAYTKLDWILWTATLTQNRDDFEALVDPVHRFLRETPDRSPMTDWYFTDTAKKQGFTARPVVGGVFLPMLYDDTVWRKWASRDVTRAKGWAKMPTPPKVTEVLPTGFKSHAASRYTLEPPRGGWQDPGYDDASWSEAPAPFGTEVRKNAFPRTRWTSPDIWVRRVFDLPEGRRARADFERLELVSFHDEDAEVYLNGVLAARLDGFNTSYDRFRLSAEALDALRPTGNVLAVHCRQTSGGQYLDVGLVEVEPASAE